MKIKIKKRLIKQKIYFDKPFLGYFLVISYKNIESNIDDNNLLNLHFALYKKTSDSNIIKIIEKKPETLITIKECINYCKFYLEKLINIKKLTPKIIENLRKY
jgi:hypothetical protein